MSPVKWIGWDTETALIRPGVRAPELACLTACEDTAPSNDAPLDQWPAALVTTSDAIAVFRGMIQAPAVGLVGANVAFDMCVMMQADPSIIPAVFDAYDNGRVTDVQIRQKLLDVAGGRYRKEFIGQRVAHYKYSLEDLTRRLLGWQLSKPKIVDGVNVTPEHWRLRYGELIGVPVEAWPAGAVAYAMDDARATIGCYLAQEVHAEWLADQYRRARCFMALDLISAWGLRTRPDGVDAFATEVERRLAELQAELVTLGLVRPDGTRDMKATARLMLEVCAEKRLSVIPTKGMRAKIKGGREWSPGPDDLEGVALDSDTCERADDPRLDRYSEYVTLSAVGSKDLPMLRSGIHYPLHTRFDMAETGRTTSSNPNVQNVRRLPGIRECFVPRAGHVFMQADYPGLELKTLAQVCIWLFGRSDLANAINAGMDPHLMLAANLLHTDYVTAEEHKKAPEVKNARQLAKIANFGYPGGLGYKTFIDFARQYDVILTEEEAEPLKANWLATWPEMRQYFKHISAMCEADGGEIAEIVHPKSERRRGRVRYTAACNGYFQGLGIDAAGAALWEIQRECYVPSSSPLYGTRPVNFVHDEVIGEVRIDDAQWCICGACKGAATGCTSCKGSGLVLVSMRASNAVKRLCAVMVDTANEWLPDVPFTHKGMEPTLMVHWSKNAQTLYDVDGNVAIWSE